MEAYELKQKTIKMLNKLEETMKNCSETKKNSHCIEVYRKIYLATAKQGSLATGKSDESINPSPSNVSLAKTVTLSEDEKLDVSVISGIFMNESDENFSIVNEEGNLMKQQQREEESEEQILKKREHREIELDELIRSTELEISDLSEEENIETPISQDSDDDMTEQ